MTYDEWLASVPEEFKHDSLWNLEAYRLALFASDLAWSDVTLLGRDHRTRSLADQLYRAAGGVCGTISEGYSRGTGRERARFYEFSLGSARETRDWYYQGRHVLGEEVFRHRIDLLTRIIRLLLTMIPDQRRTNYKLTATNPAVPHVIT